MNVNGQQITKSRNLITDSGHIEMTKDIVSVVVGWFMFNSLMIFYSKEGTQAQHVSFLTYFN